MPPGEAAHCSFVHVLGLSSSIRVSAEYRSAWGVKLSRSGWQFHRPPKGNLKFCAGGAIFLCPSFPRRRYCLNKQAIYFKLASEQLCVIRFASSEELLLGVSVSADPSWLCPLVQAYTVCWYGVYHIQIVIMTFLEKKHFFLVPLPIHSFIYSFVYTLLFFIFCSCYYHFRNILFLEERDERTPLSPQTLTHSVVQNCYK